jgi:hypothetical protein
VLVVLIGLGDEEGAEKEAFSDENGSCQVGYDFAGTQDHQDDDETAEQTDGTLHRRAPFSEATFLLEGCNFQIITFFTDSRHSKPGQH